jgi:hypothetical protein
MSSFVEPIEAGVEHLDLIAAQREGRFPFPEPRFVLQSPQQRLCPDDGAPQATQKPDQPVRDVHIALSHLGHNAFPTDKPYLYAKPSSLVALRGEPRTLLPNLANLRNVA